MNENRLIILNYKKFIQLQYNRYAELCTDSDVTTTKYTNFINANNDAAEKLIQIKKKLKQPKLLNGPRIKEARENLNKAFKICTTNSDHKRQQ